MSEDEFDPYEIPPTKPRYSFKLYTNPFSESELLLLSAWCDSHKSELQYEIDRLPVVGIDNYLQVQRLENQMIHIQKLQAKIERLRKSMSETDNATD
jgi:hypothetical protein